MDFWGWVCDLFTLTPEQESEYRAIQVEHGYADDTAQEWEDTSNYLSHMPYQKDVWYDGEFTGYYQFYRIDQYGRKHYNAEIYSFYAGHTGEVPDLIPVVIGEVVEEHIPVYMRLQGRNY